MEPITLENIAERENILCAGISDLLRRAGKDVEIRRFEHKTGNSDIDFKNSFYRAVLKEQPSAGFFGRIFGGIKDRFNYSEVSKPITGAVFGFYSGHSIRFVDFKYGEEPNGILNVFFYQPMEEALIAQIKGLAEDVGYEEPICRYSLK